MKALLAILFLCTSLSSAEEKKPEIGNLIKCDGVRGERWYLSRLRTMDGKKLSYYRLGSGTRPESEGGSPYGNILDIYKITEKDEKGEDKEVDTLYLDMYHKGYVEILCPKGYRILTDISEEHEYINGVIHKFDDKKPFTGRISEKYEDGKLWAEYELKDGFISGKVKAYSKSGALLSESFYKANKLDGLKTWYSESGKKSAEHHFKNGLLHGSGKNYNEKGVLVYQCNWKEGVRDGEVKEFFDNGKIHRHYFLEGGEMKGVFKRWNEFGELVESKTHK